MSDSIGLIVIAFLGVIEAFCIYYSSTVVNNAGDQIATGFIGERPIPAQLRWLLLYSRWVSYWVGAIATPFFVAIAMVLIADRVDDVNVKLLGYLATFMGVGVSVMWLAQGGMQFLGYRALLRQAEAD